MGSKNGEILQQRNYYYGIIFLQAIEKQARLPQAQTSCILALSLPPSCHERVRLHEGQSLICLYRGSQIARPAGPPGHGESRSGIFLRMLDQMSWTLLLTFYLYMQPVLRIVWISKFDCSLKYPSRQKHEQWGLILQLYGEKGSLVFTFYTSGESLYHVYVKAVGSKKGKI